MKKNIKRKPCASFFCCCCIIIVAGDRMESCCTPDPEARMPYYRCNVIRKLEGMDNFNTIFQQPKAHGMEMKVGELNGSQTRFEGSFLTGFNP